MGGAINSEGIDIYNYTGGDMFDILIFALSILFMGIIALVLLRSQK